MKLVWVCSYWWCINIVAKQQACANANICLVFFWFHLQTNLNWCERINSAIESHIQHSAIFIIPASTQIENNVNDPYFCCEYSVIIYCFFFFFLLFGCTVLDRLHILPFRIYMCWLCVVYAHCTQNTVLVICIQRILFWI